MILELGCGVSPSPAADVHHDRTKHSDFVDVAHDLQVLPWPWEDGTAEQIFATDVFEHLGYPTPPDYDTLLDAVHGIYESSWWYWLDECWRILEPDGVLTMRLPAWDNPLTYRDPTHRTNDGAVRAFHHETFDFWDPCRQVWRDFGRIYPLSEERYWHRVVVARESGDLRYVLRKVDASHRESNGTVSKSTDPEEDA